MQEATTMSRGMVGVVLAAAVLCGAYAYLRVSSGPQRVDQQFLAAALTSDARTFDRLIARASPQARNQGLLLVAQWGRCGMARRLIAMDADLNTRDACGWTPLIHAAKAGHHDLAELLIECGADVSAGTREDVTALTMSAMNGDARMTRLLLDAGAAVNTCGGRRCPLLYAVYGGSAQVVAALLACGAAANCDASAGTTPLVEATIAGHEPIVRLLLDAGADEGK